MELDIASGHDAREIKHMLRAQNVALHHHHILLHEILNEMVKDPERLATITARLKASADALKVATESASQPL